MIPSAASVIREHRKAYIAVNLLFYGLMLTAGSITAFVPKLQSEAISTVDRDLARGGDIAAIMLDAYESENVVGAAAMTFLINVLLGVLITMIGPSLVVPFIGFGMGIYRAVTWGLLFSPITPDVRAVLVPHALTVLIEGQAYVIAMLAIWIHGRSWVLSRRESLRPIVGYGLGLRRISSLTIPIVLLLAVAAVYEAVEVIYLIPLVE
jgi:hypothetical protein